MALANLKCISNIVVVGREPRGGGGGGGEAIEALLGLQLKGRGQAHKNTLN